MEMKFCEDCNNLMDFCLNEDSEPVYVCSHCSRVDVIDPDTNIAVTIDKELKMEEIINTNEYISMDPTIPTIINKNIKCINEECLTNKNMNSSINYIKYNEDELKFLYICNVCGQKWTNEIK